MDQDHHGINKGFSIIYLINAGNLGDLLRNFFDISPILQFDHKTIGQGIIVFTEEKVLLVAQDLLQHAGPLFLRDKPYFGHTRHSH